MYFEFPAASRQEPSAEYVMVVNCFVPGELAAVRRDVSERPPEMSRRASSTEDCVEVERVQNVSWPSREAAASSEESERMAMHSRSEVSCNGSEDCAREKMDQRRIVRSHDPDARVLPSGVKARVAIGPSWPERR